MNAPAPASTDPIFIGGMFKSGTSLVRAMLGQHPAIASGLETNWFELDFATGTGHSGASIVSLVAQLAGFYGEDPAAAAAMAGRGSAEEFLDQFMAAHTRRVGKRRWAEKTPGNATVADRVFARWPNAKLVHVVRDPRDTFVSLRQAGKWGTIDAFGDRWMAVFGALERFRTAGVVTPANTLEVRYEALVAQPRSVMRPLLAFLGEEWDPVVAQFQGQPDDHQRVLAATGKDSTTLAALAKPLHRDRVGIRGALSSIEADDLRAYITSRGLGTAYMKVLGETLAIDLWAQKLR